MTSSAVALGALGLALLGGAAAPATAAGALAQAGAHVVEAVPVSAWLGVPVSVQDLLGALDAPAGPATGGLVARVPGPPPPLPRLLPPRVDGALESRQSFGIDALPSAGAALLPRGPAAAVSIAAAAGAGDAAGPLVITIAFN